MDTLDVARWQFGITTVYHFLFVPLTIGLSVVVAGFQTAWYRTGNEKYLRLTKFFGKLFLLNFAMGLVTGLVQEFQFGMNWSDYSRFVGDIFGAPLAIEALLAFFLESTFLGLWIFGWDRLSKRLHLMTIWLAAFGTIISAYFILVANSFMQNPVGYKLNEESGRAELSNFLEVLGNKVAVVTFFHTITAAFLTAGCFVLGISLWQMFRHPDRDAGAFRSAARASAWLVIASAMCVAITGDRQAKVMVQVQPMKMASAEALYDTEERASFSVFTIGTLDGSEPVFALRIPGLLSFLSADSFNKPVEGINNLQSAYELKYADSGITDFKPNIPVTYWSFRFMIGFGMSSLPIAAFVLWKLRKPKGKRAPPDAPQWMPTNHWWRFSILLVLLPLLGNSFGWIFTEMGRQPWVVFGLMPTARGVSPGVSLFEVILSLTTFTLVYALLAVIEVKLLWRYIKAGMPEEPPPDADGDAAADDSERPLAFAY